MDSKGRGLMSIIFVAILSLFLSACSDKDVGIGISNDEKAIFIGSVREQRIEVYSASGILLGEYRIPDTHFTGFELCGDGRHLLIYGNKEKQILVYDTVTGKRVDSLSVGTGVKQLFVLPDRLLVLQEDQKHIAVFDHKGQALDELLQLPFEVESMEISRDPDKLYLIHARTDQVSLYDMIERKIISTWDTIANPTYVWENATLQELWVGGHGSASQLQNGIARYSLADGRFIGEIPSGQMPIRFFEDDDDLYVVSHGNNHLMKVSSEGEVLAENYTGLNPYAIDGDDQQIYVASYDQRKIEVYDKSTLEQLDEFPVTIDPLWLKVRGEIHP